MPNPRCCSVRGHHTNKSTVFSPNGAKFGQQSLLHEHMMNHYKLIDSAKSSIDNKAPKCMSKFVKAQDRKSKLRKSLTQSWKIDKHHQQDQETSDHIDKKQFHSSPLTFHEEDAQRIEEDFLRNGDNFSPFHQLESPMESFVITRAATAPSYKTRTISAPSRSSTPRYKTEMYAPKTRPPTLKGSIYNDRSMMKIISSMGDRQYSPEIRASSSANFADTKSVWSNGMISYKKPSALERSMRLDMSLLSLDEQLSHTQALNKYSNKELPYYAVDRLQKQEELIAEEQLYLQFIEEVTTDIMTRGIFSDRVLKQVFDAHLEKRKGYLNEERMRTMIDELKIDLNVQDSTPSIKHLESNTARSSGIKSSEEVLIKRHNTGKDLPVENSVPVFGDFDSASSLVKNETAEENKLLNLEDSSEKYEKTPVNSHNVREMMENPQQNDGDVIGNLPIKTESEIVDLGDSYENEDFENDDFKNDGESEGEI